MFAFHENKTLMAYVPKKYKSVVLISTMHHDIHVDTDGGSALFRQAVFQYGTIPPMLVVILYMTLLTNASAYLRHRRLLSDRKLFTSLKFSCHLQIVREKLLLCPATVPARIRVI